MTYDVVVWQGERPSSDQEAGEVYDRLIDAEDARDENGMPEEPPSPSIAAFITDLLDRWPDIDQPGGENSPWAMSPLRDSASGRLCCLCMTITPMLDEAVPYIAQLAQKHELVCYDPQFEQVIG